MATMCSHPTSERMWHDPLAFVFAMQKEAYHRDLVKEAVNTHIALTNVVEQYLSGNKVATKQAPPPRTGVHDVRTRLPLRRRYEQDIDRWQKKKNEARITSGRATSVTEQEATLSVRREEGCGQ